MGHPSPEHVERPKVSLITVVLNGGDALRRTFDSVFAQSYQPIEYIVIDGGSTDGSIDLIEQHNDHIAYWVSEPDNGISDAFNKGIAAAKGDLIGLLNADDWLSPTQIEEAVGVFQNSEADFVFGDLLYHQPDGDVLHLIRGDPDYGRKIHSLMPALNHPTMLVKREVFNQIGGFDPRYSVAMDYDWVLRAHQTGHRGVYAKKVVGHMTLAGTSDRQFVRGLSEVRQITIDHGQSRLRAWLLFAYRIIKGMTQRLLQRVAPDTCYRLLRGWINRDYQTAPSGLGDHVEKSGSQP